MEKGEKNLNYGEAALIIGISEGTLRNWLSNPEKPQPPCRKIGRRVYFYGSELERWLADRPYMEKPAANASPKPAKGKAIKITFTAEEWQSMALILIENDIKDTDSVDVANYCKATLLNAAKEVLNNANKSNNG
jgi:predicted DNA-binding transcriptional regulator AlpA